MVAVLWIAFGLVVLCIIALIRRHKIYRDLVNKLPHLKYYPLYVNTPGPHIAANEYLLEIHAGLAQIFYKIGFVAVWIYIKPIILFFNASSVEALLSKTELSEKSEEYHFLTGWLGTGLLTSSKSKWKKRRKMLTPAFHFRIVDSFIPIINEKSHLLVKNIQKMKYEKNPNLLRVIKRFAIDVMGETSMGVNLNTQNCEDCVYSDTVSELSSLLFNRVQKLWLYPDFIFNLTSDGRKFNKATEKLHEFTDSIIQQKKAVYVKTPKLDNGLVKEDVYSRKKLSLLEILLETHMENEENFTLKDVREEVDTFMFAGHDTTAIAIYFGLWMLGLHSDVQQKVFQEIEILTGGDRSHSFTADDLREMKYLECAIKETERLFPSVPVTGRLATEDFNIGKHVVPKGTMCWIFYYMIHRDPEIFPNPENYDPDRFLPENVNGRHPYAFIPFSAGPRNCIGQKFAMFELKMALASLVRRYHIISLDPRDKVVLQNDMVLRPSKPLNIIFKERSQMVDS